MSNQHKLTSPVSVFESAGVVRGVNCGMGYLLNEPPLDIMISDSGDFGCTATEQGLIGVPLGLGLGKGFSGNF